MIATRATALVAALTFTAGALPQSKARGVEVGEDPYTRGDPEAVAKAGYVAVGEIEVGPGHDSAAVELDLGQLPYAWIETAHFRILSTLPPVSITERATRLKVREELARLAERLPRLKPKRVKVLDRWLRAHLFAQRCEDLYADISKRLGVTDANFPARSPGSVTPDFMGIGPYLGQAEKFSVMLFELEGSLARYSERFVGSRVNWPTRQSLGWTNSLWFGTALELGEDFGDDTVLHCHVAYNVACNLVDGYKHFGQDIPAWWRYGVGAWYARGIDPDYPPFERVVETPPDMREGKADWEPRARRLAMHGGATPAAELLRRMDCADFKFRDYIVAWSMVDFLMSRGDEGFAKFMARLKQPAHGSLAGRPTHDEVLKLQDTALREAWGLDVDQFDVEWRAWAKRKYR